MRPKEFIDEDSSCVFIRAAVSKNALNDIPCDPRDIRGRDPRREETIGGEKRGYLRAFAIRRHLCLIAALGRARPPASARARALSSVYETCAALGSQSDSSSHCDTVDRSGPRSVTTVVAAANRSDEGDAVAQHTGFATPSRAPRAHFGRFARP